MGKPAATDRPCLTPLSHSFTLDFVANFQYRRDAEAFHKNLTDRFGKMSDWNWPEEKTRVMLLRTLCPGGPSEDRRETGYV